MIRQLTGSSRAPPSRDTVYLLGDLVNRGPASLKVLQRLAALGDAATCLLGNHDLHLLAAAHGVPHLRELVVKPYVLLYAHGQDRVVLLALKHQRELQFHLG